MNQRIDKLEDEEKNLIHFIAKHGTNCLLCIALNPKEENEQQIISHKLDLLANYNGYDGWILCFVNSTITNDHHSINKIESEINNNYLIIEAILMNDENNIVHALVCWGNELESINQKFLKQSCYKIINDLERYDLKLFSTGLNKEGNPKNILNSEYTTKFKKFNSKKYLENIKKTTKIDPEITINGIEFK